MEKNLNRKKKNFVRRTMLAIVTAVSLGTTSCSNDVVGHILGNIRIENNTLNDMQSDFEKKLKENLDKKDNQLELDNASKVADDLTASFEKTTMSDDEKDRSDLNVPYKKHISSTSSKDKNNSGNGMNSSINNGQGSKPNGKPNGNNPGTNPGGDKNPGGDNKPGEGNKPDDNKPHVHDLVEKVDSTWTYKGKNTDGKPIHVKYAHLECTSGDYAEKDYIKEQEECNTNSVNDEKGITVRCDDGCGYEEITHVHPDFETVETMASGDPNVCYTSYKICVDGCGYRVDMPSTPHVCEEIVDYDDWNNPTMAEYRCTHKDKSGSQCVYTEWRSYETTKAIDEAVQAYRAEANIQSASEVETQENITSDAPKAETQVNTTSDAPKAETQVNTTSDAPKAETQVNKTNDAPKAETQVSKTNNAPKAETQVSKTNNAPKAETQVSKTNNAPKADTQVNTTSDASENSLDGEVVASINALYELRAQVMSSITTDEKAKVFELHSC